MSVGSPTEPGGTFAVLEIKKKRKEKDLHQNLAQKNSEAVVVFYWSLG